MDSAEMAAYIQRWQPVSVPPQAAAFARDVVAQAGPGGQERAKNTPCVNFKPQFG
jgi:hypothetical protein